jgi:hypothetical protein
MPNRPRRSFNPKRALADPPPSRDELIELAARVRYGGNPEHKRSPGDFGLTPPSAGQRSDKTRCDGVGIVSKAAALDALQAGVQKGLISRQRRGSFPQNIWSVRHDGAAFVLEAQLENQVTGTYHGYPLQRDDDLWEAILRAWNSR